MIAHISFGDLAGILCAGFGVGVASAAWLGYWLTTRDKPKKSLKAAEFD